jgi:hypothetical protein
MYYLITTNLLLSYYSLLTHFEDAQRGSKTPTAKEQVLPVAGPVVVHGRQEAPPCGVSHVLHRHRNEVRCSELVVD